jgi:hypothetical protein
MEISKPSFISELIISINVSGGISFKIDTFNPKMVYRNSLENRILFIPMIPITMNELIKSNVGVKKNTYRPSDFINVFSNPQNLNTVIQYIKTKTNIKPLTIEEAERKGYIKNNIDLILSIYFDNENKLTYNNRIFPIHSYTWNGEYSKIPVNGKSVPNYKINIELYLLDNRSSGNNTERNSMTCDLKRRNIAMDLKELGFNINIPNISGQRNRPIYGPSIRGPYNRPTYNRSSSSYNRPTYNRSSYNRSSSSYNRPTYNQRLYNRPLRGNTFRRGGKYKSNKNTNRFKTRKINLKNN